mmetsp:Transcript_13892/g.15958  ORF Transcript_13892/g.15958 Transcript_13892/m.15958 type:complete len:234 (+) Transcript_13892:1629-2330(+)
MGHKRHGLLATPVTRTQHIPQTHILEPHILPQIVIIRYVNPRRHPTRPERQHLQRCEIGTQENILFEFDRPREKLQHRFGVLDQDTEFSTHVAIDNGDESFPFGTSAGWIAVRFDKSDVRFDGGSSVSDPVCGSGFVVVDGSRREGLDVGCEHGGLVGIGGMWEGGLEVGIDPGHDGGVIAVLECECVMFTFTPLFDIVEWIHGIGLLVTFHRRRDADRVRIWGCFEEAGVVG